MACSRPRVRRSRRRWYRCARRFPGSRSSGATRGRSRPRKWRAPRVRRRHASGADEIMATATLPQPRPGVMDVEPYRGGEAGAPGFAKPIRLASNESALGPSPRAMAAYAALAAEMHRYPDGESAALRRTIARHYGLGHGRIVCGNGSDELIGLLTRAYAGPGDEVLYSRHGFLMYPIAATAAGAKPVTAPERDLTADV